MIKNGCMLQESILLKQGLKFLFTDKEIIRAMLLTSPRGPGSMGYGNRQIRNGIHQLTHKGTLSGAGRRTDDKQGSFAFYRDLRHGFKYTICQIV